MTSEAIDAGAGASARAEAPSQPEPSWVPSRAAPTKGGSACRRVSSGCISNCVSPNSACNRLGSAGGS